MRLEREALARQQQELDQPPSRAAHDRDDLNYHDRGDARHDDGHRLDQQQVNGDKPTLHLFNGVSQRPSPNSGQATTVLQSHEAGAPVPVGVRCFAGSEANARTFGDTARNCLALARLVLPCGGRLAAIPYVPIGRAAAMVVAMITRLYSDASRPKLNTLRER